MVSCEFAKGDKTIGIIMPPKYYNWKDFVGSNFGIPLRAYDSDIAKHMITISTFERSDGKKLKKAEVLPQVTDILSSCQTLGVEVLLVVNSEYFKILTNEKLEEAIGSVYNCVIDGYEDIQVLPCINPAVLNVQPNKKALLDRALSTLGKVINGTFKEAEPFKFESYELVTTTTRAKEVFQSLLSYPLLTADIETTGLRVGEAEILTIAFAWNEYNAVSFALHDNYDCTDIVPELLDFFDNYEGSLLWHNSLFDLKHLIYNYYMKDFSNLEGLYDGCEKLGVGRCHDSMLMAYAELNSTERPPLGLKVLAKEFLGNWAEDTKDCTLIPLADLASYNAKDCCATSWVYNKFKHQADSRIYQEILQPSIEYLLHEMLNGVPISIPKVHNAIEDITLLIEEAEASLKKDKFVAETEVMLNNLACIKYNSTHKGQKEVYEFDQVFNPNSSNQLRVLLYDVMGFEPVEYTNKRIPKTDRASLKEFASLLLEEDPKLVTLKALQAISETAIIKSTFLQAFKDMSLQDTKGNYTLHGNHRLGAVMSGRLSSNEPNMANSPSNSRFGKVIKSCFVPPKGWLYAYADYNALEDRVSTLLTKDPAKLKEVLDGYEGHSLRASVYFKDELEERGIFINPDDKESVNRVQNEAADLRQKSKSITFLKIYGGRAGKIQKTLKCSRERAEEISDAFDNLYRATKQFNDSNILLAKQQGYLDVAFGLRVKCPRINAKDSKVASSEGRSINNSSTQSYGMLTNKASIIFLEKLKASKYPLDIKMINQVHDCIYFIVKEDVEVIKWLNDNLIEAMSWKDDPALEGPVPMEAELDIGYNGAYCKTLKNSATIEDVQVFLDALKESNG